MFGYKTQKCLYRKEKKINAEGKLKREEEFNREIPGMYLPKDFELVAMWTGTLHRSSPSAQVDRKRLFLRFIVDIQKKNRWIVCVLLDNGTTRRISSVHFVRKTVQC